MKSDRPILLVDDDAVDAMMVKRALTELGITNTLLRANNGEEALEILGEGKGETPALILLDLNMPKMNGIEFLRHRAQQERLITIPVVVLSTSRQQQDKYDCYMLGIAGYMIKPVDYTHFVTMMDAINRYWDYSELPD
ncbi:MAG: response regulator [Bacteroidota bacterium]